VRLTAEPRKIGDFLRMALSSLSFDEISERDLLEQIQAGVPEGVLVDYKRDMYGRADADVREFLKDVSSFANTAGGHLIIGMDEDGGIPTALAPLTVDADQERQRLENLARDGLEPRVVGLLIKAVNIANGGWNTGGYAQCDHFEDTGKWNPYR
jgi:hypothetical protein